MKTISLTIRSSDVDTNFNENLHSFEKKQEMDNRMANTIIKKVFNGQLPHISNLEKINNTTWEKDNQIELRDNEHARYRCYQYALVDPREMKQLHNRMNHPISSAQESVVKDMVEDLENGKKLPTPPIAFKPRADDYDTYLHTEGVDSVTYDLVREGRHRIAASLKMDLDKIPVAVTARRVKS